MILTVDIGNSRIKWASWQAEKIVARGVAAYTVDKSAEVIDKLFSVVEKPVHIFALCVAGNKLSQGLGEWSEQHWQLGVEFLKTEKQFNNIVNAYDDPEQHGVDRWAAVVAGHQSCPGFSVCVINAGTAITFDLINKNGQHLGGYILPSYVTMHKALLTDTVNVKSAFDVQFYEHSVPDNTNDAVNQGLHKLLQAGIREICQFSKQKMDPPMQIIISGGSARTILDYPDMPAMIHKPDLVMQGLYNIMKQHQR
ncbi:MAG: pantothenate kinase [Gammaproteobacteria bacterium]|nr:MAG: pantothenate kinase [Gammaproteobacteria bacterium]